MRMVQIYDEPVFETLGGHEYVVRAPTDLILPSISARKKNDCVTRKVTETEPLAHHGRAMNTNCSTHTQICY